MWHTPSFQNVIHTDLFVLIYGVDKYEMEWIELFLHKPISFFSRNKRDENLFT